MSAFLFVAAFASKAPPLRKLWHTDCLLPTDLLSTLGVVNPCF